MSNAFVLALMSPLLAGVGAGPLAGFVDQHTVLGTPSILTGRTALNASEVALSPAFGFSFLFVGTASCSIATGVCTTTIVNTGANSSYDLKVDGCHMDIITYSNNFYSVYNSFGGTVGGFLASRLPAGGVVTATCTLPTTLLTSEPSGQSATGYFTMELINSLNSKPPGTNASVAFEGIWISSPTSITTTATVTSISNLTITTTSTVTSAALTTSTTTVTPGGGTGFPYTLLAVPIVVVLLVASYLAGRRFPVRRAHPG